MLKKIIIPIFVAAILLLPQFACAADALGTSLLNKSVGSVGLESSLENSTANVIKAVLTITGTIFLILTVVAGIMWMTAAGNDEKVGKAKKIIIGAVIGLAVVLFAYTITAFVAARLGESSQTAGSGDGGCAKDKGGVCVPVSECPSGFVLGTCPASGDTQRVCCGA